MEEMKLPDLDRLCILAADCACAVALAFCEPVFAETDEATAAAAVAGVGLLVGAATLVDIVVLCICVFVSRAGRAR